MPNRGIVEKIIANTNSGQGRSRANPSIADGDEEFEELYSDSSQCQTIADQKRWLLDPRLSKAGEPTSTHHWRLWAALVVFLTLGQFVATVFVPRGEATSGWPTTLSERCNRPYRPKVDVF